MAQDIRKMMQEQLSETPKLSEGHEARFADRLESVFQHGDKNSSGKKNSPFYWLKIAAILVVAFGIGYLAFYSFSNKTTDAIVDTTVEETDKNQQIRLGDISPDLKKIEEFYLNGINVQLASLQTDQDNKDLIDGYMQRLSELDKEYARLNLELNEVGPTEATITALIDNLKLRLELLFKLKNKLKELKKQENDQFNSITT